MAEVRRKREKSLNSIGEDFSLPLTEAQKEMWLAARMSEAASRAHNNTFVIHLRGDLRVHALLECLQELVDRHDALRTSFDLSEPKQYVAASSRIRTPIVDLTQKAQAEKDAELTAAIQSESDQAFDVTMSPLLRARLVKLSASHHVLLLTSNHLVADNWSVDVLLDELNALYAGRVQGLSARLAPAMQFREYVRLLNEPAQRESMSVGEAYWLQHFTEPPALTDLPSDFRRPVMRTYEAGEESRWLGPDLSQMMRRASAKQECSPETFLLAVFKVLVNRLTGQEDLVVAIPAVGQTAAWLKQESGSGALVGHCVNFLPVRSYCRTHLTFTHYLKTLETVVLNACKHQSFTYGSLLAKMPLPRDPGRTPLVSLVFHLDRAATGFNLQGLDTEVQEAPRRTALFDLELKVAEFDQDLKIACTFNSDLFAAQTIQRWLNHYRTLLADVLENPDKRLSELALLTTEEQRQILVEWNDTAAAYPREACVHELFEEQVLRTPDSVAVVCEDRQLTYHELNQQANQLAHYLRSLGVGPETLVGLCLERSPELVVAVLGILKAGGAYVPLDPTYPSKRLSFMVQDCHAALILTHSRFLDQIGEAQTRVVCVDKCKRAISAESNKNLAIEMTPDQPLYVLYTSGSTGTPKGVVGLHRGAVNRVTWMWRTYPFAPDDVSCLKTTFSFVDSVWEMFGGLLCGVRTIVIPDPTVKDPVALANTLATHGVTRIVLVPSLLRVLLENCGDLRGKVPRLRIFISSGEALSLELCQRFRRMLPDARLINLYGSSEVAADVTCCDTTEDVLPTYIPIGRPIANTQVYVLDAQRQPVPISVPGELYVGGAGVARGYLNRPELTAERFVGNPFDDDPDSRLFRTGDLCRWRADGNLEFLGRLDGQVKLRGFRIELGEIESVLDEHPDVAQSVVTLREDRPGDKRLAAYCVPSTAIACEAEKLRRFLGKRLPDYMVPSAYVFLQALPLTPNGKVDRRALPSISAAERRSAGFVGPRDKIERKLIKIWEELLGVRPIGVKDNFFDLGGHSLLATRLIARIEKSLGNVSLSNLFQSPTIESLARELRQKKKADKDSALVLFRNGGSRPPLFVHGGSFELSRHLGEDQPCYGIRPHGQDGRKAPATVEDMAADYLKQIRGVQPQGPYLIGGFSFGGLVAYEMAQQLRQSGQEVALLVLIDPTPPRFSALHPQLPGNGSSATRSTTFKHHMAALRQADSRLLVAALRSRSQRMANALKRRVCGAYLKFGKRIPSNLRMFYFFEVSEEATRNYAPTSYQGRTVLLSSQPDTIGLWRNLVAGTLEVHQLEGDHLDAIKGPRVELWAKPLKSNLSKALR